MLDITSANNIPLKDEHTAHKHKKFHCFTSRNLKEGSCGGGVI